MPKPATAKKTGIKPVSAVPILNLDLRLFYAAGLYFILFTAPFMRGLFFQPELLLYQVIVGVTFLFCIGDQLLRRDETPSLPLLWAAGGLLAAYLFSLASAVHIRPAIGEALKVLSYLLVLYAAFRYVRNTRELRRLLLAGYFSALGVAVVGVLAAAGFLNFPGAFDNGVINSTLQYKNALAAFLTMFTITGIAFSLRTHTIAARLAFAAANTLMVVIIVGSQSRAGWLLFPAAIAVLVLGLPPAYRWRALYHAIIVVSAGLAAAKGFYAATGSEASPAGLPYLSAGLIGAIILQLVYTKIARRLNAPTVTPVTRQIAAAAGVAYLCMVIVLYAVLASGAYPLTAAAFMSPEVAAKTATISNTDPSFQQRLLYYRDAIKIVGDYPFTGAGGGGWNALYHRYQAFPYWSTEAHSSLFQTWVEAGTLGFAAFLGTAAAAGLVLRRLWRRLKREDPWIYVWAAAVAVLTLGTHSIFDFDLSLPALGFTLWALLGALSAIEFRSRRLRGEHREERREERPEKTAPDDKTVAVEKLGAGPAPARGKRVLPRAAAGAAGLVLAVALIWPSAAFYRAGKLGALGAQALQRQELDKALGCLLAAHRADPFTAAYAGDIAQIYAVRSIAADDAAGHFQAVKWARLAESREPYNLSLLTALVNLYHYINEPLKAAAAAESLLAANPFLTASYEVLARMSLEAAVHLYRQGKPEEAAEYLRNVADLPEAVACREAALAHRRFGGQAPRVTPFLNLLVGQAHAIRGDYAAALKTFEESARDPDLRLQAETWRAAVLNLSGRAGESAAIIAELRARDPSVVNRYSEIRELLRLRS
ncbi:MAG: O-antigen ligase family protein [Bacillota bacterium]